MVIRRTPEGARPHVSAFDIVFDRMLTVSQNGVDRELTVDEALQLKTYQAALKGSKMAVRAVLKMIEKREVALAAQAPKVPARNSSPYTLIYDTDSAHQAMEILGIASIEEAPVEWVGPRKPKLETWAAQAAISRPGRRQLDERHQADVKLLTKEPDKLKWPRGRAR